MNSDLPIYIGLGICGLLVVGYIFRSIQREQAEESLKQEKARRAFSPKPRPQKASLPLRSKTTSVDIKKSDAKRLFNKYTPRQRQRIISKYNGDSSYTSPTVSDPNHFYTFLLGMGVLGLYNSSSTSDSNSSYSHTNNSSYTPDSPSPSHHSIDSSSHSSTNDFSSSSSSFDSGSSSSFDSGSSSSFDCGSSSSCDGGGSSF